MNGPSTTPVPHHVRVLPRGVSVQHLHERDFLPAIWKAMQPVPQGSTRVDAAWSSVLSPEQNINVILDMLVASLKPLQKRNATRTSTVCIEPTRAHLITPPRGVCLKMDEDKVRANRYLLRAARGSHWGYVRVELYRQDGNNVFVSAHRFVRWAMGGGPPDASLKVVMHDPCNRSACLSPSHLRWGTYAMNRQGSRSSREQDN
jgi:hypothetical protein